jgi:hypothetical protein
VIEAMSLYQRAIQVLSPLGLNAEMLIEKIQDNINRLQRNKKYKKALKKGQK